MLCLMHQSGAGRLEIDGRPMTENQLAKILGDNPRTIKSLLTEIELAGVSSRIEGGFIASRRLIQDLFRAEKDKLNGSKGGNPSLQNNNLQENGVNPEDKAQKPEARSHMPETINQKEKDTPIPPQPDEAETAVAGWNALAERHGLSSVRVITPIRRKHLKNRMTECGGVDGWAAMLEIVEQSPLLLGKVPPRPGGSQWRASLDWIIEGPNNFAKVMEKQYVERKPYEPPPTIHPATAAANATRAKLGLSSEPPRHGFGGGSPHGDLGGGSGDIIDATAEVVLTGDGDGFGRASWQADAKDQGF
jgi:hypothetical protein